MPFPPTDWLDWTTAEYEVGAPATSLSFERWFRNPVALAQGAPGAPRVEGRALGNFILGTLDVIGTGGQGFTGLDRHGVLRADFTVFRGNARILRARYTSDNGATWGGWQNIGSFYGDSAASLLKGFSTGVLFLNLQTGVFSTNGAYIIDPSGSVVYGSLFYGGTHTIPSACNGFQLSWNAAVPEGKFSFMAAGGLV